MAKLAWDGGLTCALSVRDLDAAIAWYRDVLGFSHMYTKEDIAWAELSTGVARVSVGLSQTESGGGPGGATLTFGVKNLDEARAALEAAHVRFDGETQTIPDMVKLATFFDPDGNALMLYEDLAQKA